MADMWYYTSEGKQMEPVSAAELKRLASSGILKPTDLIWKEGMSKWVRASSARDLFSAEGIITATPAPVPEAGSQREHRDDRARRDQRRDPDRYEDEDEDRPRRRRRHAENAGMSTGLKVGLIVGGSVLGVIVLVVVIMVALRASARAQVQQVAKFNNPPPVVKFNMPPPVNPRNPAAPGVIKHPPVYRGPLNVGAGGLVFNEQLNNADARDVVMQFSPCKVFTVNMIAGKTYTIRHTRNNNSMDPLLRVEDSNFTPLALDDDSGGDLNALLVFRPPQTGVYRVIATTLNNQIGSFTLQITEN